jgi:hypothetical protein
MKSKLRVIELATAVWLETTFRKKTGEVILWLE